jgi:hypothetical protein
MKPHKHAELIKVWADGTEIEQACRNGIGEILWYPFKGDWQEHYEYRIKPEPKPKVVRYGYISWNLRCINLTPGCFEMDNVKFIFDGETDELKSAEVIK